MRTNDLVKAILKIVELRGLEPLTFSLRRLHLAAGSCVAGDSRCIVCILIMVMMLWAHGRTDITELSRAALYRATK